MRIVHLGTGFLPVSSTAGRSVEETIYELTRHLARQVAQTGSDVRILDISTARGTRGDTGATFSEVAPPPGGLRMPGYSAKVIWFSLRSLPILYRLIRSRDVDIVHAHSQFPAAAALLVRKLSRRKVPVVYTAHNPYLLAPASPVNRLKHTLIEGWVLRRVDRVLAQTKSVGSELSRRFRVPPDRVAQVFAGIDLPTIDDFIRRNPRRENGHRTVLYPAIIDPRKNQMAVVQSIPEVVTEHPECRFVFAGAVDDPAYFSNIQDVIAERGLSEYVDFTGHLSREALYQQYRDATALVFPTRYESQGKVLVEAMAFELPVIASRIGPITDVVNLEEGSAVLVDPDNTEELASAIIRLLQDEPTRAALSARGRKLAASRFSWARVARDMLTVYQGLVSQANSAQSED